MAEDTLASWTPTVLTKYIRDLFQNQPPDFLPNVRAENIDVSSTVTIRDKVVLPREPRLRKVGGAGQPPFTNSWVNYDTTPGWSHAAFWKDPFGFVHLRGLIKSGTVGNPAFTLPPGHRPYESELFPCVSNATIGRVDVLSNGQVTPTSPSNNTYVSLSGITFRTTA